MDLKEISRITQMPVKVLWRMRDDGAFSEEMTEADMDFFNRLNLVIGKTYFIRHCVLKIRSDRREGFLRTVHLETKWERYIHTHMVNHYSLGNKLDIEVMKNRVEQVFQFKLKKEHIGKLKRIRNTIYKRQEREKFKQRI